MNHNYTQISVRLKHKYVVESKKQVTEESCTISIYIELKKRQNKVIYCYSCDRSFWSQVVKKLAEKTHPLALI